VNEAVLARPEYSRTTARATTNANDGVYRVANQERMLAAVTGNVTEGYQAAITVASTFQVAAAAAPTIASGGVTNAASGVAGVAPGAWIGIYGSNLSPVTRALAASDIVNNTIPTSLGGVGVQINGKAAFIQYVSPAQVNVLAPADAGAGNIGVTVANAAGTSAAAPTTLQPVLPGLSVAANYVRAVRHPDGAVLDGAVAAKPGDIVSLYGTGFGPANAAPAAGAVFTGAYETANPVTVTVGGQPAQVLWAGLVGPGLYQINVAVPSVAAGDQPVVASVAGARSQTGALLKVGSTP
jgi:uncharacterized protein (TIGR03437 family)